jgi:hypothetical protein
MKELPERLKNHRGDVVYAPEQVGTEDICLIAQASTEANGAVTAEMVRRYNAHNELVGALQEACDDLYQINNYAEECEAGDGPINQIIAISGDCGEKIRVLLAELEKELSD